MATEHLYEHLICGFFGVTDCSGLIAVLQAGPRGQQLSRLVIRVDISDICDHPYLQSTFLRLCPNIQSIYLNTYLFFNPYLYSDWYRSLSIASIHPELLQTPGYERFWSVMDRWRSLTICFDTGDLGVPIAQENILPPSAHSGVKEFINLKHIVFTSRGRSKYYIRNLTHWPLPSLTHLTISSYIPGSETAYDDVLEMLQSSQLGPRLKYFALFVHKATPSYRTTISGNLELLKYMPNLEEVALPFFWISVPPPIMTVTLPRVHTVGMENDRLNYTTAATPENAFSIYAEICCRLFPNMRRIITTSKKSVHTVDYFLARKVGPMVHLKKAAEVLRGRGIKFEDCAGWDIIHLFLKESKETLLCP